MTHRRPHRTTGREPLPGPQVTVSAAVAAGWSRSAQRHAVARGDLCRPRRGVLANPLHVDAGSPEWRIREIANLRAAQAASLQCPRAVVSHFSAAVALGLPTFGSLDRPCLTVAAGTALRALAGVHLHRATLPPDDITGPGRIPVTTVPRTVMDVAREHGVVAGVVAADYALHHGLVDRNALAGAYELCARWPGRKAARMTLLLADGRSESVLESVSRMRMLGQGLTAPDLQAEICDEHGRYLGRTDFYWDEYGVVGEADGALKYRDGTPSIMAERARHAELEDAGLVVVRWGWSDLSAFDPVARRLRTAFARGARRGSPQRRWGLILR